MGKHLKQLEKELLEAQIKLESIQLDINQEVSRLYYKEHPPLEATVGPKGPKATGIEKTFTKNLWSNTPKKMKYSSTFNALTGIEKRFQEDMIDEMDSQY